jgi:hypothetical protein
LNLTYNASRLDLNAFPGAARVYAGIGRLLLMVTAATLITTPLTQRIWTWDRFLHGGQDFELGLLAILTTLCLVLLLAQHCKQSVDLLLTVWYFLSFICHGRLLARNTQSEMIPAFRSEGVSSPVLGAYNLPLQI